MTNNNASNIAILGVVSVLFTAYAFDYSHAFAQSEKSNYTMVGDVSPVLTFTFRDGVETLEFPVFHMGENFVSNSGATFSVEGTVTDSPLLHKAMDEAYKNRLVSGNGFEYQYKYFDVDVNFVKDGKTNFVLDYNNCRVDNYRVETLDSNDYESYFKEVGFAIVDKIDFECSGVTYDNHVEPKSVHMPFTDYGPSGFNYANDVRTSVTFLFDNGMEKIEFPLFELMSGYRESTGVVTAEFKVEGILEYYPLLYEAIDNARQVSGRGTNHNADFGALVEFTDGKNVLRGLNFKDCRVSEAEILTKTDKEEGFTGKSGFAVVHKLGFECSGFAPINANYGNLTHGMSVWQSSHITNTYEEPIKNSDRNMRAIAVFTYPNGIETVEFSMFTQGDVLTSTENVGASFTKKTTYPTFELRGIVGDYPMLYKFADDNQKSNMVSGTQLRSLADIDIKLMYGDNVVRSFDYSKCRTIDYVISAEPNSEESYVKSQFALENIFDFECVGYMPNNPMYDAMHNSYDKAQTTKTGDLRNTDQWGPGFTTRK